MNKERGLMLAAIYKTLFKRLGVPFDDFGRQGVLVKPIDLERTPRLDKVLDAIREAIEPAPRWTSSGIAVMRDGQFCFDVAHPRLDMPEARGATLEERKILTGRIVHLLNNEEQKESSHD